MKDFKSQPRIGTHSPLRSVSLLIRDYQVTLKIKGPVPQAKTSFVRYSVR